MGDEILKEVLDKTTILGIWLKLKSLYMTKSLTNKLYQLQMGEGMTIKDHLDLSNKIILELKSANVKIEDEDQVVLLLCSFPSSYENLVDTMMS